MKIGIQTSLSDKCGYGRWKDDTYKKLREHGYSCSDYNMSDTDSVIYTATEKELAAMLLYEKELASSSSIEIIQAHGPWRWPARDFNESDRDERMEKMKKSIRAASIFGCKNWVVHPLMPYGTSDAGTENAKRTWDINFKFMTELLKTAKEYDITICLENMPMYDFSLARPTDVLKFVRMIDDGHFKICLDTGHVAAFEDLVLADEVKRLGSEIYALHIHDTKVKEDLHLMPYFGAINWTDFAEALRYIGFKGCFSLETIPSRKLPDEVFDDMCRVLAKIAGNICEGI